MDPKVEKNLAAAAAWVDQATQDLKDGLELRGLAELTKATDAIAAARMRLTAMKTPMDEDEQEQLGAELERVSKLQLPSDAEGKIGA